MNKANENKSNENLLDKDIEILSKLLSLDKEEEKQNLIKKMNEMKEKYLKTKIPENIARAAIISFVMEYNPFHSLWKNINIRQLSQKLVNCFKEKKVIDLSISAIDNSFKEPSPFRTMISFEKKINKEKKHLECYFKLIMIKQNIQEIIEGINNLIGINKKIENQLKKLNFQNPYSIIFIRDLLYGLIVNENEKDFEKILKKVKENMKEYYIFHCQNCLEILYAFYDENSGIILTCINSHKFIPKNITQLRLLLNLTINCKDCGSKIEIYENNYKCINCQDYFCNICANKHERKSINCILICIYEIGFICNEHYRKYKAFCPFCKRNLCDK